MHNPHPFTLKPISEQQFDSRFPVTLPQVGALAVSEYRRLEANGETYQLTRVTMPDGEVRKFADQFNGYGHPHSSEEDRNNAMRFGCAWSRVEVTP